MAASEKQILEVLDMLTLGSVEALSDEQQDPLADLQEVLASENVVGVGIAKKRTDDRVQDTLALTFYVREKVRKRDLSGAELVPPAIPEVLSGPTVIPTDVVELGEVVPEANVTRNPVQPGHSIGHLQITAGTFGAVVRNGSVRLALSNSHVLANSGLAAKGDTILYPGTKDGGLDPSDAVGQLVDFVPFQVGGSFVNRVDAAVCSFSVSAVPRLQLQIKGLIGLPTGTSTPRRDMNVLKVGRTTDLTEGRVVDVNFRFVMSYPGVGQVGFLDQVLCTRYTQTGDSGALVLEKGTHRAVGLHFAGANGGSVFSPITEVLRALNIRLEM